ncbi:hypothetical protein VaNZ11_007381 [Volvox africanus]|uniref:Deacetylase sirtuin-type domain-containing protein n=1 Tax=Volvox africanus TaxID=51714 RepID=A0ABQ5S371_9CHLO|nr:hypothetical protein VaNZ11_007381 [Volvox africanus]
MELRKRRPTARFGDAVTLDVVLNIVERCRHIILFTGSGISAASGMSMFTTSNGLYERARKKFKVQDGIKLFTYSFYRQRRAEVQDFFAQIYSEAQASRAATGHHAMAQLLQLGALQRHYTLNIDGLSEVVGMDTWHHERNPQGSTVEMHGNIRQLVCPTCHAVEPLSRHNINVMRAQQPVPCASCGQDQLRFKVMLYDDGEGDCITPEHVFDVLEEDLKVCDMVVWAGISFQQSASVEYFRRVRHMLGTLGRLNAVPQVLINPSEEPYFNLLSAMSNPNELQLLDLRETSDIAFPAMAQRVQQAIMCEDDEYSKSVGVHMSSVNNGVHPGAGAFTAAAAAARIEPTQAAAMAAKGEDLGPAASECAAGATELRFGAKTTEVPVLSSIKLEAGYSDDVGTRSGILSEGCLVNIEVPVDATASASGPEPEPTPVRSCHIARSARVSRSAEKVEEGEAFFADDADDEDYIEGVEEEEGRCRRNGRGRGRGRGSASRGKGRGRGRGRGGGSAARAEAYLSASSSQLDQRPLSPGQISLGQLLGVTPGTGVPGAVSSERSLLPLVQPGLRLAFGGLPQLQQQQLTQVAQHPQLPLFQPLQKQEMLQQGVQPLQQLQQFLQLQQLAQLRQQQQPYSLGLLQRLHALHQQQGAQQQSPALNVQLAQSPQQQQQDQHVQISQQAQGATSLQHIQQLSQVQFVSALSTLPGSVVGNGLLDAPQSQLLGQDALTPQQEQPHLSNEAQSVQAHDQPAQHERLVGFQQRTLLQQNTHGGSQSGLNVSGVWPDWFTPGNGEIASRSVAALNPVTSSAEAPDPAWGGSGMGLLPLAAFGPSSVAQALTTVVSNLEAPMHGVFGLGGHCGALSSGATLNGPSVALPVEFARSKADTG